MDDQGEIYLCQMSSIGGRIYTLARAGPGPPSRPVPSRLSQTRVFSDLASLKPAPGLIPYAVNSPFVRDTNGYVYSASYKWRPDLSDADLVTTGLTENIRIPTRPCSTRLP